MSPIASYFSSSEKGEIGSLTSVGAGTGLPSNRGWMVRFPERLQVYRGFPDRGSRLRGAVARVARWIWRGLHVEFQIYCLTTADTSN